MKAGLLSHSPEEAQVAHSCLLSAHVPGFGDTVGGSVGGTPSPAVGDNVSATVGVGVGVCVVPDVGVDVC